MSKLISTMLAAVFALLIALPSGVSEGAQKGQNEIRNLNQSKSATQRHAGKRALTVKRDAARARAQDLGEGFEPHDCVSCYRYYYRPYSPGYYGYYGVWPRDQY